MRVLKPSSRWFSAATRAVAGLAAVAAATAPGAMGQKKARPDPPAPTASQSYESIVNRPLKTAGWAPRPVVAARPEALVAVAGGRVFVSGDGGARWQPAGALGEEVVALAPVSGDAWRAIGRSGRVLESRDGGRTWSAVADLGAVAGHPGARVAAGGFDANGEGWAALEGVPGAVVATIEGAWARVEGARGTVTSGWRAGSRLVVLAATEVYRAELGAGGFERVATLQGAALNAVAFAEDGRAWIGSDRGLVLETRDGGTTWLPRPAAGGATLDAVGAAAALWAVGVDAGAGVLYASTDGGLVWRRALAAAAPLSRPVGVGGRVWVVDGQGVAWSAPALEGPWRRTGELEPAPKGPKNRKR